MNKLRQIGFFYFSRYFQFNIALFFDRFTWDFPTVYLNAGMCKAMWLQDNVNPDNGSVTKLYYDCYGIKFLCQLWFFQLNIVLTPFTFRQKTTS